MVEKDGRQEPATEVRWPGDFENQYVKWQAPVLTAKEAGGVQWLRADVGGRDRAAAHHDLRAGQVRGRASIPKRPPRS